MMTPDDPRHGSNRGYNAGCHEACCRKAHARDRKRLRCRPTPLLDCTGARRRVDALALLGYDMSTVSRLLGHDRTYVRKVTENDLIHPDTHQALAALYDRLSMTPHGGPFADRIIRAARARRAVPALGWDDHTIDDPAARPNRVRNDRTVVDEVAVQRLLSGDFTVRLTTREREVAVARWMATGRSLRALSQATGWKTDRYYTPGQQAAS